MWLQIRPFPQNPLGKKLKIDIQQSPHNKVTQLKFNEIVKYMNTIMKVVHAFAKDKGIKISEEKLHVNVAKLIKFEISLENVICYTNVMSDSLMSIM